MKSFAIASLAAIVTTFPASAGSTSSNSSSNTSNGVHTRVETIVREDERARRIYEERMIRELTRDLQSHPGWGDDDAFEDD